MKKYINLIIGIVFSVLAIVTYVLRENKYNSLYNEKNYLSDIATLKEDNVDKLSYIKIRSIPSAIAEYNNDKNAYYVVFDNQYLYVIYMNKDRANKIDEDMVKDGYEIIGITKANPEGIEEYGINFLNELYENHEEHEDHDEGEKHEEYSINDYADYFGNVYLDTTISKYYNLKIYTILIWLFSLIGLSFIISKVNDVKKII